MLESTTRCFRCNKEMKVKRDENGHMCSMLSQGLFFMAYGNYGSTVFDPIPIPGSGSTTEFLEIVVCDDCIKANQNEIDHVKKRCPRPQYKTALFEVDKE